MIPDIFPILAAASGVTALVGTNPVRVFPFAEAPQSSTLPYVTWAVFSGDPQNAMDSVPQVDVLGAQIDVWGATATSTLDVAAAVRDALEPHAHMVGIGNMSRDSETKTYRIRLDFDFFTER